MTDIIIQSVAIRPDETVEITYMEPHDRGNGAALIRTLLIEYAPFREALDEILESVQELIDEALLRIRNPKTRL